MERGGLIGDRDEVGTWLGDTGLANAALRFRGHGIGFDRRARLARQHEQRRRRSCHRGPHRIGIDRIEHLKAREPWSDADDGTQHFGREARAAHPEQDDVRDPTVSNRLRERVQSRQLRRDGRRHVEPAETVADLLLNRAVGAPHVQAARPQRVGKVAPLQTAVGVVEGDVDGSWVDRDGHGDTMILIRMPRMILCALLSTLPLLVAACGPAGEPGPEAALGAAAGANLQQGRLALSPRIVFLGDSLTAGLGLPREQAVPSLIQERLDAEGFAYEVVNAGVSGDTSAGGLSRLDWSLDGDVAILVIELGANDGLRGLPVSQMKRNLSEIITRARQRDIFVILTGMEAPPNYGIAYTSEFRQVFRDLADQHEVAFVPFFLDGVAGIPSLNNSDGMHPNAAGAQMIAGTIWRALVPVLETQDR